MRILSWVVTVLVLVSSLSAGSGQKNQDKKDNRDKKAPPPLSIKLNVNVLDAAGHAVSALSQDRFRVFEDDLPQTISVFQPKEKPGKFVIAIDASLSLRPKISVIIEAAKLVIMSTPPGVEVELVKFISSDKINTEQSFTTDKSLLLHALDNVFMDYGQSAIIDAVYLANDEIEKHTKDSVNSRNVLLLITDGEDRRSYYRLNQLLERLRQTGVQVFAIGFPQQTKDPKRSADFLNRLAQETGGVVYYPAFVAELQAVARQIELELGAGYVVGYDSTNVRDGELHKVRVEVVQSDGARLSSFSRAGYMAPRN